MEHANDLDAAKIVILPGTKNTVADLRWLCETGIDQALIRAAQRGVPIVGICGGYQMLGESVRDDEGVAGDRGVAPGLNLLPIRTTFSKTKEVVQVWASWRGQRWQAYEIHMGVTLPLRPCAPLCSIENGQAIRHEGCQCGNVWGTYLHGLFESPAIRSDLARRAGFSNYRSATIPWREHLRRVYDGMADVLEERLNLERVWNYVAS